LTQFLNKFGEFPKNGKDAHALLNTIAMSACYSPNPEAGPHLFDLPFDEKTGELNAQVWNQWKKKDPVELVKTKGEGLKTFGIVYIDCGNRDEFALNLGARIFSKELSQHGIQHEYQEFEGGHFNIQDRYDVSLRKFADYFTAEDAEHAENRQS
jgi:S-formylglutathione hydrolase FrmB